MCDSLSPDVSGLICHDMMGNINKVREELDFLFSNIRDQGGSVHIQVILLHLLLGLISYILND